jgi:hypothetical protein
MNDEIWQKLLDLVKKHTGSDGRLDLAKVEAELADFLSHNRDLMDPHLTAQSYIKKLDNSRKVKPRGSKQTVFAFEPDGWLTVGDQERVEMRKATREDAVAHIAIITANHAAVTEAYAQEMAYWNSRLQAWKAKYKTLQQVEINEFGSQP